MGEEFFEDLNTEYLMEKDVMLVAGAGQISMAIARRVGYGKKIVLGDKKRKTPTP